MEAIDHFAVLGLQKAPWLDEKFLKPRFLELSAKLHPDAGGSSDAFAALNAAWQVLRDPVGCLRHFLELEHPDFAKVQQGPPPDLGDLFMEIASLKQRAQQLSAKFAGTNSPLAKALMEPGRRELLAALDGMEKRLASLSDGILLEVRTSPPEELPALLSRMTFARKWLAGVREMTQAILGT